MYANRVYGWIGGRTQNPLVFLRYAKLGTVYPFDQLYTNDLGISVMKYLLENIAEVKEFKDRLNLNTGICRGVYPEGKLGDYPISIKGGEHYEKLLRIWRFNRENGDAIITVVKLTNPIL